MVICCLLSVVQHGCPQDPILFTGTIADNIAYGKYGKATTEEVRLGV